MKPRILKKPSLLVQEARVAQVQGNFSALGRIINRSQTTTERGFLLGMLACEIALRKRNLPLAKSILQMARGCFIDDYENLEIARRQGQYLSRFAYDLEFQKRIIDSRAAALEDGRI